MQEHSHSTKYSSRIQTLYRHILETVSRLYQRFVPSAVKQRRNVQYQKQQDIVIITTQVLGKLLGFTSERSWHAFLVSNLFTKEEFPERSRYHRLAKQVRVWVKWFRVCIVREYSLPSYTIIDSIPLPLCHSARMFHVKRMRDVADIGYCASKKFHYFGLKGHFQATNQGFVVSYVITAASVHDITATEELISQAPHRYTMGDKGYVGKQVQKRLQDSYGTHLIAQTRSNSKNPLPAGLASIVRKKRKQIETLFSGLCDVFHLTRIRATSVTGYELALDSILFAHTLLVKWSLEQTGEGTRWKEFIWN